MAATQRFLCSGLSEKRRVLLAVCFVVFLKQMFGWRACVAGISKQTLRVYFTSLSWAAQTARVQTGRLHG